MVLTNRHLQRQVAERWPPAAPAFRELADCFEDAWYGGLTCHAEGYTRAEQLASQIKQAVEAARDE